MTAVNPVYILTTLKMAASADLCSIDDVKLELNITSSASDTWLAKAVTAQSRLVANHCRRDFVLQTDGEQIWERRGFYLTSRWRDRSMHAPLQLRRWPLTNVPSTAGTAPPLPPTLGSIAGGSLAARKYYVKASYVTATGETAGSIEGSIAVAANRLLTVAAPGADLYGVATGWNVYVATSSWGETLQASLGVNAGFVEPGSGLVNGAALPNHLLVVENYPANTGANFAPTPLAEGLDFVVDAEAAQLSRLYLSGYTRPWPYFPITVHYSAGFATIPPEVAEAAMRLVAMRYAARGRDPTIKSETVFGVASATYVAGDARGAIPSEIADILGAFRMPLAG